MNRQPTLVDLTELDNPHAIMMVGIPGSVKTHIANQIAELTGHQVLSSDEMRRELSGDATNQAVSRQAWQLLFDRAEQLITDGESVIIDGTNNVAERRRQDIRRLRQFGARAVAGVHVIVPIDIAFDRNKNRERFVPEYVIEQMNNNLSKYPPSQADGFDFIIRLDNS